MRLPCIVLSAELKQSERTGNYYITVKAFMGVWFTKEPVGVEAYAHFSLGAEKSVALFREVLRIAGIEEPDATINPDDTKESWMGRYNHQLEVLWGVKMSCELEAVYHPEYGFRIRIRRFEEPVEGYDYQFLVQEAKMARREGGA